MEFQIIPPKAKRAKKRQEQLTVSHGQIVAQLTFYFWKRLFADNYESSLWKRSLKKVFPNKTLSRAEVALQMEVLYQMRNRLAHHEPIYGARLENFISALTFVETNLGTRHPNRESSALNLYCLTKRT